MVYSKYLTGKLDGSFYDKREILSGKLFDKCYLFDMSDGGSLIVGRAPYSERRPCEYLSDIMDDAEIVEMLSYLRTVTGEVMLVSTSIGLALALPWVFPSTTFVLLSFPLLSDGRALRVCASRLKLLMSASVRKLRYHSSASTDGDVRTLAEFIKALDLCFGGLERDPLLVGDVVRELESRIYALSRYVGCPVSLECAEEMISACEVDLSLFVGVVLTLLIFARETAKSREVSICFEKRSRGLTLSVRFFVDSDICDAPLEPVALSRLCQRKVVRFEYSTDSEIVHVCFEPIRKELSLLGVKQDGTANEEQ